MKSELKYVFLIWITTVIISPLLYYYVFGAKAIQWPGSSGPGRVFTLMLIYPFTILWSLPVAAILVFVAAIINRELQNPPLKKMLIGLCGCALTIIIFYIAFQKDANQKWGLLSIYCGTTILASLVFKLKPA